MTDPGNGREPGDDRSEPASKSSVMKRADTTNGEAPAPREEGTDEIEASIAAGGRVVGASDDGDLLVEGPNPK